MDTLARAFADVDRSHLLAKATVSRVASDAVLSAGPGGPLTQRTDFSKAAEQLLHFSGWVYSSVRPIAQRIAGQPIHVGRVRRSSRRLASKGWRDNIEPVDTHPILDLLADPSELSVAWSLIYTTVASLELTGRQLWWCPVEQDRRRVYPIPTPWIVGFSGTTRYETFLIRPPHHVGDPIPLPADSVVYFAYPHPGDPHGAVSPLQAAGAAVDADESITTSQRAMFARGILPSHAVIVGKQQLPDMPAQRPELNARQREQLIRSIRTMYAGAYRHGDPLILDAMIEDVKRLSNAPAEMDWMDSSKLTKARITQGFGVNPIIMGEIEGANRASATAADQHFVEFTVNPKIELMSQCLTEWLGPMFAAPGELAVWIEPAVANDAEMELRRYQVAGQFGAVTVNELRAWCGLPPVDWGDAPAGDMGGDVLGKMIDDRLRRGDAERMLAGAGGNGGAA